MKLRYTKQGALSVLDSENDNADPDSNNVFFTIKVTKNYQNYLPKDLKDVLFWNEYKTKSENTKYSKLVKIFLK